MRARLLTALLLGSGSLAWGRPPARPLDATAEYCAGRLSLDKLLHEDEFALELARELVDMPRLVRLYVCLGLAARTTKPCARLERVTEKTVIHRKPYPPARACEFHYAQLLADRALLTGDRRAQEQCVQLYAPHYTDRQMRPYRLFCENISRTRGREREHCEQACAVEPDWLNDGYDHVAGCERTLHRMWGDATNCPAQEDEFQRSECAALAGYRAFLERKTPDACADSAACRVWAGGGAAACRPLFEDVKTVLCANFERALATPPAEGPLAEAVKRRLSSR